MAITLLVGTIPHEYVNTKKQLLKSVSKNDTNSLLKNKDTEKYKISNPTSKNIKKPPPHFVNNEVELSRMTKERYEHPNSSGLPSSLPPVASVDKINAGNWQENKHRKTVKQTKKKIKKSVLTLPNDPTPMSACTVSDRNEYRLINDNRKNIKIPSRNCKGEVSCKRYNKLHIFDFDRYNSNKLKTYKGDVNTFRKKEINNNKCIKVGDFEEENYNPHNIWTILRNVNRLQFDISPPMSEETLIIRKKIKPKKFTRGNKASVIETCHTEEIAFISSIDVDSNDASSFDRITVVEHDNFSNQGIMKSKKKTKRIDDALTYNKNISNNSINSKITQGNKSNDNNISIIGGKQNKTVHKWKSNTNITKQSKHSNLLSNVSKVNRKTDTKIDSSNGLTKETINSDNFENTIVHSVTSGSSKAARHIYTEKDECQNVFSGISKVIFNSPNKCLKTKKSPTKERSKATECKCFILEADQMQVESNKNYGSSDKNKSINLTSENIITKWQPIPTVPRSTVAKRSLNEIKRRLAQIKFPLVILGKDQVSSDFKVFECGFSQFSGLDEHIWPFMVNWAPKTDIRLNNIAFNNKYSMQKVNSRQVNKINNNQDNKYSKVFNLVKNNSTYSNTQKNIGNSIMLNKKIHENLCKEPQLRTRKDSNVLLGSSVKNDIIERFRKKMTLRTAFESERTNLDNPVQFKETYSGVSDISRVSETSLAINPVSQKFKKPWTKNKKVNNFIENVIKKMCSGIYSNGIISRHKTCIKHEGLKDETVHNKITSRTPDISVNDNNGLVSNKDSTEINDDPFKTIPGFDDSLPLLEIKTMDCNKIVVENRIANVLMNFDVTVLKDADRVLSTSNNSTIESLCVPVKVIDNDKNIFKCKTTIINAIVPAELCAIIPKFMSYVMQANLVSDITLCNTVAQKCSNVIEYLMPPANLNVHTSAIERVNDFLTSPKLNMYPCGTYITKHKRKLKKCIVIRNSIRESFITSPLFNCTLSSSNLFASNYLVTSYYQPLLLPSIYFKFEPPPSIFYTSLMEKYEKGEKVLCKDLQIYTTYNKQLISEHFSRHSFLIKLHLMCYICSKLKKVNWTPEIPHCLKRNRIKLEIEVQFINQYSTNIDYIFGDLQWNKNSRFEIAQDKNCKDIGVIDLPQEMVLESKDNIPSFRINHRPIKGKNKVKVHRKCKSTNSSISNGKCCTAISKITTLEHFLQALGIRPAKVLSSVFDNQLAKKILSSLSEMKTWIKDISTKQAMLLLLLMNKKDTPNLLRFRPVLLQGIAVNRITRAKELNTEIEVIEKESFNTSSQFEGITYVSNSRRNQDFLLEELFWIAKTTASEYQKQFDETSEKLLKSLLQRRKKLNPSYLRVLARYVGLGLLKAPKNSK